MTVRSGKKILVVFGHPNPDSYCSGLANAYADGARETGADVQTLALHALDFDPILRVSKALQQPLETDLLSAQDKIRWAEHLVFVFPVWWGHCPALMQGFFDRTLVQGFGFRYAENQLLWERLLSGRTAHLIATMNAPTWYYRFILRDCGLQTIKGPTLGFCGIRTRRITRIGSIRFFKEPDRERWLKKVRSLGSRLL